MVRCGPPSRKKRDWDEEKQGCDRNGEGDEETLGFWIDFNQNMYVEKQDSCLENNRDTRSLGLRSAKADLMGSSGSHQAQV